MTIRGKSFTPAMVPRSRVGGIPNDGELCVSNTRPERHPTPDSDRSITRHNKSQSRLAILTSSTERVTRSEFPHTREKLAETANEERHADDNVRRRHPTRGDIDEREDEGRRREREQTAEDGSTTISEVLNFM